VLDLVLMRIKDDVGGQKVMAFDISVDFTLWYQGRLYIPKIDVFLERILVEVHESRYVIHLSLIKMYHNLKEMY